MTLKGCKQQSRIWSEQMDAMLSKLISLGLSFSEAADEINATFGTSFTRGAAIGRAHREGFKTVNLPNGRIENKPKRVQIRGPRNRMAIVRQLLAPLSADVVQCEPVEPEGVPLIELTGCKWPFGDGPFTFCNHAPFPGLPYCEDHACLAYRADTRRAA